MIKLEKSVEVVFINLFNVNHIGEDIGEQMIQAKIETIGIVKNISQIFVVSIL